MTQQETTHDRVRLSEADGAIDQDIVRVLCVDDNELVAEAIGRKLSLSGGFEWLGQLEDATDLVKEAQRRRPDVILLDIDMPGADPFVALEQLSQSNPETAVVMLSGHVRLDLIERAIEAGASGYVSKNEATQTLIEAIQRAAQGEFVLGPEARRVHDGDLS